MKRDSRGNSYTRWELLAKMTIDSMQDMYPYKERRLPMPEEKRLSRYNAMVKLHTNGAPYAWIAKLYRINRSQVRRIILNLPNH